MLRGSMIPLSTLFGNKLELIDGSVNTVGEYVVDMLPMLLESLESDIFTLNLNGDKQLECYRNLDHVFLQPAMGTLGMKSSNEIEKNGSPKRKLLDSMLPCYSKIAPFKGGSGLHVLWEFRVECKLKQLIDIPSMKTNTDNAKMNSMNVNISAPQAHAP